MNHETALKTDAAERYVLGGMSDEEAAAFEEHFFDCRECARELDVTASFAENARVAFTERPAVPRTKPEPDPWWKPWTFRWSLVLPYAAAAAFGGIALYQGMVIVPRSRTAAEPRALNPAILRVVRAEPPVVTIEAGATSFLIVVDLTVPDAHPRYAVEFRSADGDRVASIAAAAPPAGTLHLLLPADRFPSGDYTMVLRGQPADGAAEGEMIETYTFRVLHEGE